MTAAYSSPPPSPLHSRQSSPKRSMPLKVADVASIFVKLRRAQHKALLECDSGEEPLTHPTLKQEVNLPQNPTPLVQDEHFECQDAVDVARLLRAVRAALYEYAQSLGGNVLVQER